VDISELKLRAWDKLENKMVDVAMVDIFGGFVIDGEEFKERRHVELMRYTGLNDRNGKEVFEGDIVASEKYKGSVQYSNGYLDYRVYTTPEHCYFRLSELQPIEVVGNVFEHPHLLAKEEK